MKYNSNKNNRLRKSFIRIPIIFFSLLFISTTLLAQKKKENLNYYSKDGVSYTISSKDWCITDEQKINEEGFVVTFETPEDNSTGVVTTTWLNLFMDRTETLEMHKKHMRKSGLYTEAGIQFSIPDTVKIGNQKALHMDYLTRVDQEKIEGRVYCLNSGLKTLTIFFQTSSKEKEENTPRFLKLMETFGVRED